MLRELEGNYIECGELLIRSFLPASLLKDFDLENMDMDAFQEYLAKARYMQKIWKDIVQTGVWEDRE